MKSCVVVGPHDVKLLQAAVGVISAGRCRSGSTWFLSWDQIKKDDLDAQAKLL